MIRKSEKHFCGKIRVKPVVWRQLGSSECPTLAGTR
jgi:hypothetical protein